MNLAVKCIAALSILVSPCAWDSDPREASAVAAIQGGWKPVESVAAATPNHFEASPAVEVFYDEDGFETTF